MKQIINLKNVIVELSNRRETYDFSTTLNNNNNINGKVSLSENGIVEINISYKAVNIILIKINEDYNINICGKPLADIYDISENLDDIINDIQNTIEQ